jgi:predicted transcriptional regulator
MKVDGIERSALVICSGHDGGSTEEDLMPGKRVQFDDETWQALDLLAEDRVQTFQELAEEAFADVLKKHGRPVGLKEALRKSAGQSATVHRLPTKKR